MTKVLGRRKTNTNEEWLSVVENIGEYVTPDEVSRFAETAKKRIADFCKGKKAAYAWSGGKDGIVLGHIAAKAGIKKGYFAYCDLDYPAFIHWALANKPKNVDVIFTGYDARWLGERPELIFPDGQTVKRWYELSEKGPFSRMIFENDLDVLMLGRRITDGDECGVDGIIRTANGETLFSPLYDWPHEILLGYIHYNSLSLPPCYGWKDGYIQGTHAWPERINCGSVQQGYKEVYDIDKSIVIDAAAHIQSAKDFLREVSA